MATSTEIRESQRATWNRFSAGWRKWDTFMMGFLSPVAEAMLSQIKKENPTRVLDLASGTGEPGLSVARRFPQASVVAVDVAKEMLSFAQEKAERGNVHNFSVLPHDETDLPFGAEFDVVVCRFGIMFFPDIKMGLTEIKRVMKPGAQVVAAVWDAPNKNPWASAPMDTVNRILHITPASSPDLPGMFRCAKPGFAAELFRAAGFVDVEESSVSGTVRYRDADQFWEILNDVVAPAVAALQAATPAAREEVRQRLAEDVSVYQTKEGLVFPWSAKIISARA